MTDFSSALSVTSSGLKAQSSRLRLLSENIANADTPGFRRKSATFDAVRNYSGDNGHVELGRVHLDQSDLATIYDPSHPLADQEGNYEGSNVNLIVEIADAREAQRSYEANLKIFDQTRQMSAGLMELLKR